MERKKLAVLTSGGDSPAMNAAVYSFAVSASFKGYDVFSVIDGYQGLISGNYKKIDLRDYKKNIFLSGTAIGSSRCLEFKNPDVRKASADKLRNEGFSGLFVIGGDGSYMGASFLDGLGFPVIAAPGTIDNDVASSRYTIGFFSALEEIFQGIKKVKSTSESHSQITFLEVMGRDCQDLSVCASLAGGVDYVVTNQSLKTEEDLYVVIKEMIDSGKKGIVILVSERIYGEKFGFGLPSLSELCVSLEKRLGRQVRSNVLGYIQRGANPNSWDLYISHRFGMKAFDLVEEGKFGVAIGFDGFDFYTTKLSEAVNMKKESNKKILDFVNSSFKI